MVVLGQPVIVGDTGGVGLLGEILVGGPAREGFPSAREQFANERIGVEGVAVAAGQTVAIPPGGHPVPFNWTPVAGATGAAVTRAGLTIRAVATQKPIGSLKSEKSGNHHVVTTSGKRIFSLKLNGLKFRPPGSADLVSLTDASGLPPGFRIAVSVPDPKGGYGAPIHAVPAVARAGLIPSSLTGASFSSGVLRLPDVVAPRIRLTLVEGANPAGFEERPFELGSVEGTETILPRDVRVVGPDGAVAWQFAGDLPAGGPFEADLRIALEAALSAAVAAGGAPVATFTITGSGTISLIVRRTEGAILRTIRGVVRCLVEGDPAAPDLGGPLPPEVPSAATADLTVRYEGIRLLDTVTDEAPVASGGVTGIVAGDDGAVREYPPEALTGRTIDRIGLIGRAPVACDLEVQLVEAASGAPVGRAGVLSLAPDGVIASRWVALPDPTPIGGPVNVRVRATKGRFLWAATDRPLTRVAIRDPDYPGRGVTLGGASLGLTDGGPAEIHLPARALPAGPFAGPAPRFDSRLFLTIDLADLTLRYAR